MNAVQNTVSGLLALVAVVMAVVSLAGNAIQSIGPAILALAAVVAAWAVHARTG